MTAVKIRLATTQDVAAIAAIHHTEPSPSILGLAGSRKRGQRLGAALIKTMGVTDIGRPTVVYEERGHVVGFAQYSIGASDDVPLSWTLAMRVVGALGPRVVFLGPRLKARKAVALPVPPESFYLAELQVRPDLRGRGVGGELLTWFEREAEASGARVMSLVTDIGNPARRLYERHGFQVIETRRDERFHRFTGQGGRVLMTKRVERAASS